MVSEFGPSISRATSSPSSIRERERAVAILEEEGPEENGARSARGAGRTGAAPASGEARRAGAEGRERRDRGARATRPMGAGSRRRILRGQPGMEFGQPLTAPAIEPPTM